MGARLAGRSLRTRRSLLAPRGAVGTVSERMLCELYHLAPESTGELVGNAMVPDPLTVRADARLLDALELLADERFTALPVLDENDKLVGILPYVDVLDWRRSHTRPIGEPLSTSPSA